jgi:hypothetical protein
MQNARTSALLLFLCCFNNLHPVPSLQVREAFGKVADSMGNSQHSNGGARLATDVNKEKKAIEEVRRAFKEIPSNAGDTVLESEFGRESMADWLEIEWLADIAMMDGSQNYWMLKDSEKVCHKDCHCFGGYRTGAPTTSP